MLTVALVTLFALSSVVLAHGYGRGSGGYYAGQGFRGQGLGGPGLGTLMGLNLSDAQRDQALKIMESHQIERVKARGELLKAHDALRKVLQADTVNEQAVRNAYKKVSSLREDRLVARAKTISELRAILTPEQVKLLDERTEAVSDWKETRRGYGRPFAGKWSGSCPRW
jgi:Spy/CpxP family protein refolding chaperone